MHKIYILCSWLSVLMGLVALIAIFCRDSGSGDQNLVIRTIQISVFGSVLFLFLAIASAVKWLEKHRS